MVKYLILFLPMISFAQSAKINTIERKPHQNYDLTSSIEYPIITMDNKDVSNKINQEIRDAVFDGSPDNASIYTLLDSCVSEYSIKGIGYFDTYNKNAILCMDLYIEYTGAYTTTVHKYLNFDLNTGKLMDISDVVKDVAAFTQQVVKDETDSLNNYAVGIKEARQEDTVADDTSEFSSALEEIKNCSPSESIDEFSLSDSAIEITYECDFPHVMQNLAPVYNLIYNYKSIEPMLNKDF